MDTQTLHKISYGLFVVSSRNNGEVNGQIANTLFQVASDPPTVAVSINKTNLTHDYITASRIFTASILAESVPMSVIGQFGFQSGREVDKFQGIPYGTRDLGLPVLKESCVGYLECRVRDSVDVGTHTMFTGHLINAGMLTDEHPITYAYYHQVKRGTAPKSAPTFIQGNNAKEDPGAGYQCSICGYVYDPESGDPEGGIEAGAGWDELLGDWVCPVCSAARDEFEKMTG